jgi:hypothetical protein
LETDQSWEYLQVLVDAHNWVASSGDSGQLAQMKGRGLTTYNSAAMCSAFGSVGWQLAGVVTGGSQFAYQLFFKRPIAAR